MFILCRTARELVLEVLSMHLVDLHQKLYDFEYTDNVEKNFYLTMLNGNWIADDYIVVDGASRIDGFVLFHLTFRFAHGCWLYDVFKRRTMNK